jgi:hypothetical protein
VGNHQFVMEADSRIRLLFTVVGDRAQSLTLHQGGSAYPGKRKQERRYTGGVGCTLSFGA